MNTEIALYAKYGDFLIPAATIARDYFEMDVKVFLKHINSGDLDLSVISVSDSRKAPKFIHATELAAYIDKRMKAAKARQEKVYKI